MLIVGGSFDTGKQSGYVRKLCEAMTPHMASIAHNGGDWESLCRLREEIWAGNHGAVLWMPDVPNSRPKLVDEIKKKAPRILLVTSKRNDDGKYSFADLVARALKAHSGLLIEFSKQDGKIASTLMDPLGNVFSQRETDIGKFARVFCDRVRFLLEGTRISSLCLGPAGHPNPSVTQKPSGTNEFFGIVRSHAETFHKLIHGAVHPERLMGNASFRCESGFPSFRHGGIAFVSRRNIDKRDIDIAGFMPVSLSDEHCVGYWGDPHVKPSVDSPINIRLFNALPSIRFMLHSHTYVDGAPTTRDVLACGDVREAEAVLQLVDPVAEAFAVNLRGHGSLVGAKWPEAIADIKYVARPAPEVHCG